jgi:tetratricopeptide (TPR) repeat protein
LQAWPEDDRAAQLLRATERRGQALAGVRSDDAANSNGGVVAVGDASATDLDAHAAPIGEVAPAARAHDAIGAQLARLEARLQRGSLDSVMTEMQRLHDAHPGDARLCSRLARLLLQRGLLHYGRGEVQAAVEDWRRARKLDPNLQGVSQLLDAASHELGRPPR